MSLEPQPVCDEELARETQAGSLVAFEQLVHRFEGRIYRFVANSCRNGTDAREVTQDTFVRAFQAIAQFDARRSFAAWIFAIARRKCIDHHRSTPPNSTDPVPELPDHDDPSAVLARKEDRQGVWELARRELPVSQFDALWLKYAEDMSVAEAAQVLGKTQVHLKVLLFRAREKLGKALEATGPATAQVSQHEIGKTKPNNTSTIPSENAVQLKRSGLGMV